MKNKGNKIVQEVDQFRKMLDEFGIPYLDGGKKRHHPYMKRITTLIYISQALFYFDNSGKFISVHDDETGGVHNRKTK
jgi:hypothetical protein